MLREILRGDEDPGAAEGDPDRRPGPVRRSRRDWLVDVAVFLLAVGLGALFTISDRADGLDAPPLAVDVTVGSLACLLVWLRHRWPVQLAVAMAFGVPLLSIVAAGPALVLLFTVARNRPPGTALLVALLYAVAALPHQLVYPPDDGTLLGAMTTTVLLVGAIAAAGMFARARSQSLRERSRRLEEEERLKIAKAREHERARIAREMHDVLGHRISLLSLHAGALEMQAGTAQVDVADAARVIREGAHEALDELREVIGVLRTDGGWSPDEEGTRPQPTLTDLPRLVEECRQAGMRIVFEQRIEDPEAVPEGAGRHAYRVVQEGLTNARKHAPGEPVAVDLSGSPGGGVTIEVRNATPAGEGAADANGRDDAPGSGAGLVGLSERLELAGGRLTHGRVPETGEFRLRGWLP